MSNNSGSSLRQQLLDGAPFRSSLLYTAIPQRAASGTTATFTRATTSTWQNNDGYQVTGVAGEIGFPGARRVRNLIPTTSEDYSNAVWTKGAVTVGDSIANPVSGSVNALKIKEDNTSADHRIFVGTVGSLVVGNVYVYSFYAKAAERSYIRLTSASGALMDVVFNLGTGAVQSNVAGVGSITSVAGGWYRCSVKATATVATTTNMQFRLQSDATTTSYAGTTGSGAYAWGAQLEDVTAQTTQTAGEYVSVGVESAPYYHGSMVDGVKCFPTDLSGNPLTTMERYKPEAAATNVLFKSNTLNDATWTASGTPDATQNATGIDGATSAWTLTDNNAAATELILQNKTLTAATWTGSVFVNKTSGAQASYPIVSVQTGATTTGLAQVTIDTSNGIATPWTAYTGWTGVSCTAKCEDYSADKWRVSVTFTGTAAAWYFVLIPAGTTNPTQSTGIYDVTAQGSAVFERAQLELGSVATSYIDNTSAVAAATRNADVLTYTGGDIANLKTLMAGFRREVGVSNVGVVTVLTAGTDANTAAAYLSNATASAFAGVVASVTQWSHVTSNAYTPGTASKMVWSQATNDIKMAKDGIAQTQDTVAIVPASIALQIGHQNGAYQLNGNVGGIYGWTRNLSQSELNAITS